MPRSIYGLFDPRDPEIVRYVGYTQFTPEQRLRGHIAEARYGKPSHRCNWIRSLLAVEIKPAVFLIEEVTEASWKEREIYWISHYGATLVNGTVGGDGLVNPSQEIRDRIATKTRILSMGNQYRLGIPHSAEDRAKISNGLKKSAKFQIAVEAKAGINPHSKLSEEQLLARNQRISQSKLGKKREAFSAETRDKMRASHIGIKLPSASEKKLGRKAINNGTEVRMLGISEELPEGWNYGSLQKGQKRPVCLSEKLKEARQGTKFINDGNVVKVLKAGEELPPGWFFGNKPKLN